MHATYSLNDIGDLFKSIKLNISKKLLSKVNVLRFNLARAGLFNLASSN
jgi:hypothetical protein